MLHDRAGFPPLARARRAALIAAGCAGLLGALDAQADAARPGGAEGEDKWADILESFNPSDTKYKM